MSDHMCSGCGFYDPDFGCICEHEWECPDSDVPLPLEENSILEKHLIIRPSGVIDWIDLERRPDYGPVYLGDLALNLHQIHGVLGCSCVEQVHTVLSNIVLVIDESGKIKDPPQPHNELASRLYRGYQLGFDDICGPALVMRLRRSCSYGEEDWGPLDPADLARLSLFLGVKLPAL